MKKELKLLSLSLLLVVISGCRGHLPQAPKTDLCVHSIENKGFVCIKPDNETTYFLPYIDAKNYFAQSPEAGRDWDVYILNIERELTRCQQSLKK